MDNKFIVGRTYFTKSICNSDVVYTYEAIKRTKKTVLLKDKFGKLITRRIYEIDNDGLERINPEGSYSMCPVICADRYFQEAKPEQEQKQEQKKANIIIIGQKVIGNFGACFPLAYGKIIDFEKVKSTKWTNENVLAVIEWDNEKITKEEIDRIYMTGHRSSNGSSLGIYKVKSYNEVI